MRFVPTALDGVLVVEPERLADERGYFARTWCASEFAAAGLPDRLAQVSMSHNHRRGTLRGLHFQRAPHAETKLVRCTAGAIFDVAVDLRPGSSTLGRHVAVELSQANGLALLVPPGCAHGFQVLADGSEVLYAMDLPYEPSAAGGVRWNDPAFGIAWPVPDPILNSRDAAWPDWSATA